MTEKDILEIIYTALRAHQDPRINDVTNEADGDVDQIVITTEDGPAQVWVLGSVSICETEPPLEY